MGDFIIETVEAVGKYFGIGLSDAERKRGKYGQLYYRLNLLIGQVEADVAAISRQIRSYEGSHPVPKTKVPGVEFSASRGQVDDRLKAKWQALEMKLSEAKEARSKAKQAFNHYQYVAAEENRKKG